MAKPITLVPLSAQHPEGTPPAHLNKADATLRARGELRRRLDEAPAEHAEALLALWELLDAAHEHHVLDIATGAISSSADIISRLADAGATEPAIRGIRNALLLSELLGSLDPEALHALVKSLPPVVAQSSAELAAASSAAAKPPSLWQIFRRFTSADSRRALGVVAGITNALGRSIKPKS
jgi:uncharacterized protein YjgD (DUF1641 family)